MIDMHSYTDLNNYIISNHCLSHVSHSYSTHSFDNESITYTVRAQKCSIFGSLMSWGPDQT